jgi:hypothetical protein
MLQSLFSKSSVLMLAIVISANLISCAQTPAKDANNGYKAEQEGWLVNLDEAYALSKKTNKPIMANFTVQTGADGASVCPQLSLLKMILKHGQRKT